MSPYMFEEECTGVNVRLADLLVLTAPKHYSHTVLIDSADPRTGVVPCQLLPYGLPRSTLCSQLWRQQNRRLDARLRRTVESTSVAYASHGTWYDQVQVAGKATLTS